MTQTNGERQENTAWQGMPWWVKAIAIVGVPSLLSVGIVWSDRIQLTTTVRQTATSLENLTISAKNHDTNVRERFDLLTLQTAETNRILVATCVNAAVTVEARERCIGR